MFERGEIRSLGNPVGERLLASTEHVRITCLKPDCTLQLNTMVALWNGTKIALACFATAANLRGVRANSAPSITADSAGPPRDVRQLPRTTEVQMEPGFIEEDERAHLRCNGKEEGARNAGRPRAAKEEMTRIEPRPPWVGVIDCETRVPRALAETFA